MRSPFDLDVAALGESSRILTIIRGKAPARAAISCGFGRFRRQNAVTLHG